ncbi:ABC transporter permease subunit [Streptomyces subrutilus]|uniref:ABC transporter permease n=1 Tax=Streptomyces subrutilus TaxID=36818 RepID=A0A1E5PWD1_9ACTN|nr:ABC transporter permease subunit [Streptomyces subrutilus]OEJ33770.1 ABC transporter permease [Streptomyces subrutilus]
MTAPTPSAATTAAKGRPQDYSSPLPTPRPHLGHALASEWTKLISVRSTLWTLSALVLTVVGIGMVFVTKTRPTDYVQISFTTPALFGLLVGQLAVMVLGVLTITSEHASGLVRTTFTAAPERHRVLTAKYLVFGITAFLTTVGSVFLVGIAAALVHNSPDAGAHELREWLGSLMGCFYVTLLGVLALAVGALVRHSAGAIAVMLGVVTLPPVIGAMLSYWQASAPVGQAIIEHNAPVALMQLFGMQEGAAGEPMPSTLSHMVIILIVTGGAVAASYVTVARRDV